MLAAAAANALPQALVLTAIVIGFGLLAFALVLAWKAHARLGTVRHRRDARRRAERTPSAATLAARPARRRRAGAGDGSDGRPLMSWLLVLPILIPLAGRAALLAVRGPAQQRLLAGAVALLRRGRRC